MRRTRFPRSTASGVKLGLLRVRVSTLSAPSRDLSPVIASYGVVQVPEHRVGAVAQLPGVTRNVTLVQVYLYLYLLSTLKDAFGQLRNLAIPKASRCCGQSNAAAGHHTLQIMRSEIPCEHAARSGACKRYHTEPLRRVLVDGEIASRAGCWMRPEIRLSEP